MSLVNDDDVRVGQREVDVSLSVRPAGEEMGLRDGIQTFACHLI